MRTVYRTEFSHLDKDTVHRASKRNGILSLVYFVYLMGFLYFFGYLWFQTDGINGISSHFSNRYVFKWVLYLPVAVLQLLPVMILVRAEKRPLSSIGITKANLLKSVLIGLAAAVPFNVPQLYGILTGSRSLTLSGENALLELLYFLFLIALVEEIIFRGYLQTRIHGLLRSKTAAVLVVALLFSLMHIPFQMAKAHMSLGEFVANDWVHLLVTGVLHVFFVLVYSRTKNIVAPSLAHGLQDFLQTAFS